MTAAPEAGARAAPGRPDWRRAAAMLVAGHSVNETARTVGCSRSQLSRKRNHDELFRAWIEEIEQEDLARLRRAWHEGITKAVGRGDARILLWLADRLNLITPPSAQAPDGDLRDILNGLSPDELLEFENLRDPDVEVPAQEAGEEPQSEPARTTTSSPA